MPSCQRRVGVVIVVIASSLITVGDGYLSDSGGLIVLENDNAIK